MKIEIKTNKELMKEIKVNKFSSLIFSLATIIGVAILPFYDDAEIIHIGIVTIMMLLFFLFHLYQIDYNKLVLEIRREKQ